MAEVKKRPDATGADVDYFSEKHTVKELDTACEDFPLAIKSIEKLSEKQLTKLVKALKTHKRRIFMNKSRRGMGGLDAHKLSRLVDLIIRVEEELGMPSLTYTESDVEPHTMAKSFEWCDTHNNRASFVKKWDGACLDSEAEIASFIADASNVFAAVVHRYENAFAWKTKTGIQVTRGDHKNSDNMDFSVILYEEKGTEGVKTTWPEFWKKYKTCLPHYDLFKCEFGDMYGRRPVKVDGSLAVFNLYVPRWVREVERS